MISDKHDSTKIVYLHRKKHQCTNSTKSIMTKVKRIRIFALILIIATSINQTFSQSADDKFDAEKIFNFKSPKELTDFYGTENLKLKMLMIMRVI